MKKETKALKLVFCPTWKFLFEDLEINIGGETILVCGSAVAYSANMHNDLLKDDLDEISFGEITPRDIEIIEGVVITSCATPEMREHGDNDMEVHASCVSTVFRDHVELIKEKLRVVVGLKRARQTGGEG